MGTEDSLSVSFYNYLDEIVLNVQRLSFGCIFILVKAYQHFVWSILRYGFLFFHSDSCNLRVGEYGVRHSVVVYFDLPFEYRVVVDYGRFIVCNMFEEILAIRISKRPYARLRRLQILVDRNPSLGCCLYSRFFRTKVISYRSSPTCHHYLLCCDRHRLPSLAVESNQLLQALRDFSHFLHFMVGDDIDVSTQHLLCQG